MSLLPLLQLSAAVGLCTWLPPLHGIFTLTNRANKSQLPEKLIVMALQCQMLLLGASAAAQSPRIGIQAEIAEPERAASLLSAARARLLLRPGLPQPSHSALQQRQAGTACSSAQVASEGGTASACLTAGALLRDSPAPKPRPGS